MEMVVRATTREVGVREKMVTLEKMVNPPVLRVQTSTAMKPLLRSQ